MRFVLLVIFMGIVLWPAVAAFKEGGTVYRLAVVWLIVIGLGVVLQPIMPWIHSATERSGDPLSGPALDHPFGTTNLGKDVFSQVLKGGSISLYVALFGTFVGIVVGGFLGLVAGYFRGWVDGFVSLLVAVFLSIPALVLVTFIVAVRGQSLTNVTLAVCILAIPALARIVRASTLQVAEREYVKAAEVMGAKKASILFREVLPNVMPTLLSFAFLTTGLILVAESALSFLGLSVEAPTITWGSIIAEGRVEFRDTPYMVFLPGLVLFLTVLSLNFVGDQLLKRFDIKEAAI